MTALIYGYNPAFYGGSNIILSRQEDDQIIKNDILQLLLTIPGERVHRPNFGTRLRSVLFDQLDGATVTGLEQDVKYALSRNEPRVTVETLKITAIEDSNQLNLYLVCRLVSDPSRLITITRLIGV